MLDQGKPVVVGSSSEMNRERISTHSRVSGVGDKNGVFCTLGARKRVFLYTSSTKVGGFVKRSGTSEEASLPGWHSVRNWKARMVWQTGGQLMQAHAGLIQWLT
jgi:hypothetical protein